MNELEEKKRKIILRWLQKEESDLKVAKHKLELPEPPTDAICFHCQQAVEKYLKAFLTFKDVRVKKIHDLEVLLNTCLEKDKEFEIIDRDKISSLSHYAVEIGYPDEFYIPSVEEAEDSFQIALKMKDFIFKKLGIKEDEVK
ncbi:MAG: DNA-binding protein [Caldisericum exile]|uniref:DNA-binding protein n=1 Tax=Caldisericum exile TaxID=693075 RepID=A0A2J6X740_9BACT|nr:MAG: DNA-binding protein [Caldisericum exile]